MINPPAAPARSLPSACRGVLTLALPVVVSELGWVSLGLVDTLVVGRLGAEALGAVGLGNILIFTAAIFGMGLLLGLDTVVSQAFGGGRLDECRAWLIHGVVLAFVASVPLFVLLRIGIGLLSGLAMDPKVLVLVISYMEISSWGMLPLVLLAAFRRYLQATSIVRPIAVTILAGNLVNLGLAIALVFGIGPIPALGTDGSAWATLFSRVFLMLGVGAIVALRWSRTIAGPVGIQIWRLRRLVELGFPAAMQTTLEVGVFATATALAGLLDADSLAAHQVVIQVATLTFIVPLGIGSAAAVLVGQALGAGDPALARTRGWIALALGVGFMAAAAITFLVARGWIVAAFTPDQRVIEIGSVLLLVAAAFQLFDGLQAVATGALRGLGDTRTPMITNLGAHWLLGLPIGYLLCFSAGLGVVGLWLGLSAGLVTIGGLLLATWMARTRDMEGRGPSALTVPL